MENPDNDPLAAWPPEPPATHESTYAPIHESTYAEISRLATAAPFGGAPRGDGEDGEEERDDLHLRAGRIDAPRWVAGRASGCSRTQVGLLFYR